MEQTLIENLYTSLHRRSEGRDENFLTAGLVHLLRFMKEKDHASFDFVLERLTCGVLHSNDEVRQRIEIETEHHTELGRPDISISCPNALVFLEVKVDSGFGKDQISRYLEVLRNADRETKRLIVLTRYEQEIDGCLSISWGQLSEYLDETRARDLTTDFLIKEYTRFLTERGVVMTKVTSELGRGIIALNNLKEMIRTAVRKVVGDQYKEANTGNWQGFRISDGVDGRTVWVGVYFEAPEELRIETESCTLSENDINAPPGELVNKTNYRFSINLSEVGFFREESSKQTEIVKDAVMKGYGYAKEMILLDRGSERTNASKVN